MKLAEALAERSDCQNRIEEIRKRLTRSARVQEGEQPAEDTTELLAETGRTFARLLELVSAINRTGQTWARVGQGTLRSLGFQPRGHSSLLLLEQGRF